MYASGWAATTGAEFRPVGRKSGNYTFYRSNHNCQKRSRVILSGIGGREEGPFQCPSPCGRDAGVEARKPGWGDGAVARRRRICKTPNDGSPFSDSGAGAGCGLPVVCPPRGKRA